MKLVNVKKTPLEVGPALAAARAATEPLFVPATVFADDRGWSIMNQFQGVLTPEGQVNYSLMYPNVIKAWHRHKLQADLWICVRGHIKVGIHRDSDNTTWSIVIGEKNAGILIIPETLWHGGATVSQDNAGLLYYVTRAYDPKNADEERRAFDGIEGFPWGVVHK